MELKKRILIVSSAFYPEISPRSFRATELAKEFSRQGHAVVVFTKLRNHDYTAFIEEYEITLKMWGKSRFPRLPVFKSKPWSVLCRVLTRVMLMLFEYPAIEEMFKLRKSLKHEDDYDLLISVAVPYPIHWGVAWSRSKKHRIAKTWVADCGDPYMGDVLDSFRKPFYLGYFEKWFCRKAEYISIPVESALPAYYPEFHHKIRIIPQGFDFDLERSRGSQTANNVPEFAYAGGFLQGIRDPGLLMKYLVELDRPFRFFVFTGQSEMLDDYRQVLNGKLFISEYIPRQELMEQLLKMDFLLNFDNHTTINVPSKLIDYAITNRPVLNIDKNLSRDDLLAFLEGNYAKRMLLPDPEQFHIGNITRQFLQLS